ncbi:DUF6054 family protein [Anaerovorax odorimutans]|uniref:DUF6054 family protein n=1 Tax=Anaerovorax odorimutans TaxID=109327 RepID=A0ABT1RRC3_9FIRM|nr:DUF6054 family protein [Anaerovorax odorimutans]MCQ4637747.1 DUF6054 family protein [Anaerovorax odorimutans]
MAKYIVQIQGNIDEFTRYLENAVLKHRAFSSLKHQFRTKINNVRCCVQVFEGYTLKGGNWLTMNVTTLEYGGMLKVAVMTSGGSNNLLFKNLSFGVEGEERMLKQAKAIIMGYRPIRLSKG